MKFAVGYGLPTEYGSIVDVIRDFRDDIAECYFAMPGDPSGRGSFAVQHGAFDIPSVETFWNEMREIVGMGIKPVLLYNASCYGKEAVSKAFESYILKNVCEVKDLLGVTCITTTSPFVAGTVRAHFPDVELRASVNMRLYSLAAIECLAPLFDSFYVAKELNRDIAALKRIKTWCDAHGKQIHLLANSGCLYHCPWQTDHDSRVAHEIEIVENNNVMQQYPSYCWDFMARQENQVRILQNTWIRPEDVDYYAGVTGVMKLATRMHSDPRRVVEAYVKRHFDGNLLTLFEPSYVPVMGGRIVDNIKFPADWIERVTTCGHVCETCGYCREVFASVT